jgi:hypothetical protein
VGTYFERLGQYFKANKVDDSLKVASLLSLIGGKTYNFLRTLTSPTKPAEKSYQEIIKLLGDHLSPKPLSIAERFRFSKYEDHGSIVSSNASIFPIYAAMINYSKR